jgi:hypothetical protein
MLEAAILMIAEWLHEQRQNRSIIHLAHSSCSSAAKQVWLPKATLFIASTLE